VINLQIKLLQQGFNIVYTCLGCWSCVLAEIDMVEAISR